MHFLSLPLWAFTLYLQFSFFTEPDDDDDSDAIDEDDDDDDDDDSVGQLASSGPNLAVGFRGP